MKNSTLNQTIRVIKIGAIIYQTADQFNNISTNNTQIVENVKETFLNTTNQLYLSDAAPDKYNTTINVDKIEVFEKTIKK